MILLRTLLAPLMLLALSLPATAAKLSLAELSRYLNSLATAQGLRLQHETRGPLRQDQGQDVTGLFQWWQLPA